LRTRAERRVAARYRWDRLKVSFWFAPALMALAAVLLAWTMYWVDSLIPNEALQNSRFVLSGTVVELRSALLNMAGTVLATAGVVFTLLTLPLSTVAAQYGSRLLRLFLGDRTTQSVLGMFVGTFVYCVAGALSIPPVEVQPQGPQLTATVGLYLMLATFASLIVLVQHISTMLQAPNIAAAAGAELLDAVGADIPDEVTSDGDGRGGLQQRPDLQSSPATPTVKNSAVETEGYPVRARRAGLHSVHRSGYLVCPGPGKESGRPSAAQAGAFCPARRHGCAGLARGPGRRAVGARHSSRLPDRQRAHSHPGCQYAVNQLTEMAVRAMSPAINDPFTAMTCLDYMGEGLALFIRQGERTARDFDMDDQLGFALEPVTLDELLGAAFDMLRHASCDNASVLLHMLETIDVMGQETKAPEARRQLLRHVSLIQAESQAGGLIEQDRQLIERSSAALQLKLAGA
jgi:uncharacterized membrane protein